MTKLLFSSPDLRVYLLADSRFMLDGGAMFGVVPKVLWEKLIMPDADNRIPMGTHCLLVQTAEATVLVNTGIGNKYSQEFVERYQIDTSTNLLDALSEIHIQPDAVTHVILTHLHFDHSGWNTCVTANNSLATTFPQARYYVQKAEWETAINPPNSRLRASYLPDNILPIEPQLTLVEGNIQITSEVSVQLTQGHSDGHQIVRIQLPMDYSANKHLQPRTREIVYFSDLIPTTLHLPLPYCMAYDIYPLQTINQKKKLLDNIHDHQALTVFEHEVTHPVAYLKKTGKYFSIDPVTLSDI